MVILELIDHYKLIEENSPWNEENKIYPDWLLD